ncbi:hypothetical protein LOZ52_002628 [Ophidiomyces ophidiicola]|uniref:uncharacterized protein n=1 Tax=Ophidiomyces ophidiicola TaxID=1387563 RepID=UPI0020C52F45|nr:uncharacterized protein LOZ57_005602 [Ophidiomyces ophidiicola]KAI1905800.1 hypothetical protein LOZ64_006631 [Ophidiomyces ophidiicola]KAI1941617.1 hypothetical protein LOZ57_005602 [Ophidiomyces ophidiicola]KAI2000031.1 hypothetical protein LOZ50_006267 [Ophidiomyces ophidiicola]KAI2004825.1 hypothetical protein LOZ49_005699 [Ophidiomyces ophidiicola]KAI2018478.1 hypothetical protein LOZ46_003826 [Ophidiomyces ophidiicola]
MAATPPAKTRPYRRILTSTLHRRFVHASAFSLLVCYVVAFFIGTKTSLFWSWFPLGACGFRTLLLFISSLSIFILRVGQLHIGASTTVSLFKSWRQTTFSLRLVQTFAWYMFSAWWFSEVYIWSASLNEQLNWVNPGRSFERARLNERPIYLHCYYFLLAVGQATLHLYYDWDQLYIPVANRAEKPEDQRTHPLEPLLHSLTKSAPQILRLALFQTAVTSVLGLPFYILFLRKTAWGFTLYFAKMFWNFPRSAQDPPGIIPPLHISFLLKAAVSGILLIVLWQTSNLLFSVLLGQAPLKKGMPLTNEAKDPNGSLINGLKAKNGPVVAFSLWELCLISQQFPDRRKGIFSDIDREGGPAWSQVLDTSASVIKGMTTRISQFEAPPAPPAAPAPESKDPAPATTTTEGQLYPTLPRLTAAPKEDNIFLPPVRGNSKPEQFEAAFGSMAKSYGQSEDWTPNARAKARQMFDRASAVILSPEQKRRLTASAQDLKLLASPQAEAGSSRLTVHPLLQKALRSPLGILFRRPYARRLREVVLGSPYEQLVPIVDAVEVLTRLLVASLAEDQFGKVQNDVPAVIRLFTESILALEGFVSEKGLKVHWTDVDFPADSAPEAQRRDARRVDEVEIVLGALKTGLKELLGAFRLYLKEVGVVGKDLRMARQAAGLSALE